MFKSEDIAVANKTSRNSSAIGAKAVTPLVVHEFIDLFYEKENVQVLDYGAGKDAAHARRFLNNGYYCTAHEFGANFDNRYHDPLALTREYDIVYASNVLNVQTGIGMMRDTLAECCAATKQSGRFIANYPRDPRKAGLSDKEVEDILHEYFSHVLRCKRNNTTVFNCSK